MAIGERFVPGRQESCFPPVSTALLLSDDADPHAKSTCEAICGLGVVSHQGTAGGRHVTHGYPRPVDGYHEISP